MPRYADMSKAELETELAAVRARYDEMAARGLSLNMARGKPSTAQLELSLPMLDVLDATADLAAEDGTDCRNYGVLDGIPEAKRLMAALLDDEPENVIVLGNASLTAMYDAMVRYILFGALGDAPWGQLGEVAWLCPVPGYDRHFAICEALGIRMIPVPMDEHGPDMDEVERLVAEDASIKGIWCVPKYSNPTGITYSDEVVRRLAAMDTAAPDFRIFWDNAYAVHHFSADAAEQDTVLDIATACREAGNPDRYLKFGSTSKITFPGAGVAAVAASPANIAEIKRHMSAQAIGHDKLNQLRHVKYFKDADGIRAHMKKLGEALRPKFDMVLNTLETELGGTGLASWVSPKGGYFVALDTLPGCAKRTVALAKEAGVTMTGAGATWPYGKDPKDSNIRIAPTFPTLDELDKAIHLFCLCVKLAGVEKVLEEK